MEISFAQQEDYQLGMNQSYLRQNQGAYYDYSDPDGLNIKVSIWGYVKYPGRYVIPQRSDIKDFISYAGGVSDDSYLDDLRVYKILPDSTQQMMQFNYEDLWWNEELNEFTLYKMEAGDVSSSARQTTTLLGRLSYTISFNCWCSTFFNNSNSNDE